MFQYTATISPLLRLQSLSNKVDVWTEKICELKRLVIYFIGFEFTFAL